MEDTSRAQLGNLKRYVMVSIAAILALLEGFYFFVMKVPLVQCVLEWLFGLSVCLVILHVSFRYIFRMQDRTTRYLNQMKMLHEVGKELTSLVDLPQLLQAILDSAVAIISAANAGTIHLIDESRRRLMPRAASNHRFVAAEMGGMTLGQGVAGLAWKEKRTIHIADVSHDPRFIALDNAGTSFRSLLVAPLMMGDRCLGTISLHSNETNAFTPDDERLLSTLASQAAIAIENARLYEKVTDRMREATVLHRVSNTLMRTLNLEQLLENILEVLQRSFGYSHCAILLPDEETGELYVKAARGYLQAMGEGLRIKIGQEGITGWVAANRVPLNVPDVTKDDRYVKGVEGTKSEIAVPMLVRERVVGVLDVQSTEVNAFGEDDLRTLSSVAAQAAIAIERARFFKEARRRSREQATLFQASAAVLSTLHVGEVLYEVAKQMTLAIDATSARVCQWNEAERTVTVIAEYITPHASQKEQVSDLGTVYPVKDPRIFQVLRGRQPLTVSLSDPEMSGQVRTHLEEFGGNTVLYLPLAVRERVIGYVEVWESRRKRHFTQEEINLCQAIGNQAAIAIENARLFAAGESSRQKMEAVIQKMTDGLLIIDARCDIILANQRAAELLDATAGEMAGQNLLAMCPYPSLNALVRKALDRSPHITRGEISIEETGRYDLGVTIALFIQDGEQVLWYVLLHDITHLKELDRMKSDFVSNVSHDLRTPLANIKLYAALAQKGRPEKRQHYLATIESETERLEALIEDILDLSRLEQGAVKLQMEPLLLAQIFQQVVGAHLATAQAKGIELTWQVPDGLPTLYADRNQLLLMLNNLLGNALQYTPRGGSVRVEARAGEWKGWPALHIAVCDTGIGIPADEQERIFERFYRGRHTPADTTGTGLGLAIVKESMALHGGEVMVESTVGQGSTFTLCFPLETEVSYA
ncbi:MAG: GAF domain-containing protein [Anaerolineae bacterium]|nr:GAF domain-containing protein [Anaerolineae bacterium]